MALRRGDENQEGPGRGKKVACDPEAAYWFPRKRVAVTSSTEKGGEDRLTLVRKKRGFHARVIRGEQVGSGLSWRGTVAS